MAREIKLQRFLIPLLVLSFVLLAAAIEARPLSHHYKNHHHHGHQLHHNPRKAGPSPGGVGHYFGDILSLWGAKNTGPSPGEGH
ncbi:unnamed protein product [Prunus brigantina]